MARFVNRTHGPKWFTRKFPATGEQEAELKKVWEDFLTPKLLSTRLGTSKENVKILCYQPNLVPHQFGVSQTVPKPLFNRKSELCLYIINYLEDEYLGRLVQMLLTVLYSHHFLFNNHYIAPKNSTLGREPSMQNNFLRLQHYLNI